jgi:hypothetical protein
MKSRQLAIAALVACATGAACGADPAPTPALRPLVPFAVPFADQTNGIAVAIPGPSGTTWLLTIPPVGGIGIYALTAAAPGPQPEPPPTPPPTPPPVAASQLIVITDGPPKTKPWATTIVTAELTRRAISVHTWTIQDVTDPATPDVALRWIGKTAGRPLPWAMLAGQDGTIVWQGQPPATDAEWLKIGPISRTNRPRPCSQYPCRLFPPPGPHAKK